MKVIHEQIKDALQIWEAIVKHTNTIEVFTPLINTTTQAITPFESFFDKLVTKKQLAEHLSLSQSYINVLMSRDGLPYTQIGRAVRFSVVEVRTWLQKRSRP